MTTGQRPPWDGRGLPASAMQRIERSRSSGLSTSLLSISGDTALETVGFVPVGEVMGSCVMHLGFAGAGGCGYGYAYGMAGRSYSFGQAHTVTSRRPSAYYGFGPYVKALDQGYAAALGRMATEAQEIGAHGVIDVRLTVDRRDSNEREFVALGTAVRGLVGPGTPMPSRPFTTQLSGADVTSALRSGWVPVSIVVAICLGVRHDDTQTRNQVMTWSNTEVHGYTELVSTVRSDARDLFAERVRASGANRSYLTDMKLNIWGTEVGPGHRDHVAESIVLGGGLVSFASRLPRPTTLTMIPLRPTRRPK
ncbi:MAG TPA: heavy metal-binding domain-containing protein [Frankiaceae bacterium]|nr:heavy metal-binding domain-containing protein [Frankiaceae bacterium]